MDYNKYEKARILAARALQISMGAPILIKRSSEVFNPIIIAREEMDKGVLPITVKNVE